MKVGPLENVVCAMRFLAVSKTLLVTFYSDGVSYTGMFCASVHIIEKLRVEQEVDIFTAVKHVKTCRIQFIGSVVSTARNPNITSHMFNSMLEYIRRSKKISLHRYFLRNIKLFCSCVLQGMKCFHLVVQYATSLDQRSDAHFQIEEKIDFDEAFTI